MALLEVSVTLLPSQNVVALAVMTGVAGIGLIVTAVAADGALEHPVAVVTTV